MNGEENKTASGIVRENPAIGMPIGSMLYFQPVTVHSSEESTAYWMKDWETFHGMLLSLIVGNQEEGYFDGSAIIVAPGIALCAAHEILPREDKLASGAVGLMGVGIAEHGLQFWKLTHAKTINNSDLAILGFEYASSLPPDNKFFIAAISTRVPKVGEALRNLRIHAGDA